MPYFLGIPVVVWAIVGVIVYFIGQVQMIKAIGRMMRNRKVDPWRERLEAVWQADPDNRRIAFYNGDNAIVYFRQADGTWCVEHLVCNATGGTIVLQSATAADEAAASQILDAWVKVGNFPSGKNLFTQASGGLFR